jgi:prophage DNA circulation protein
MPFQPWRAALLPASFGGCGFKVEAGGFAGGRRLAVHEYPHQDTPFVEDLGRKARRWQITGYCIGPDYLDDRDALVEVCEAQGPFTLVHPSFGPQQVHCEVCNPVEVREKGGYVVFELVFVEAGQSPDDSTTTDTQAEAQGAAAASNDATASTLDDSLAGRNGGGVSGINAGAGSGDPLDGASGGMGGYPGGINPGLSTGPTGFVAGGV